MIVFVHGYWKAKDDENWEARLDIVKIEINIINGTFNKKTDAGW